MGNTNIIGFVAVNFNNSYHSINYVKSLLAQSDNSTKLIVVIVDNASNESEFKLLEEYSASLQHDLLSIHLIKSLSNVGYFRGLNLGLNWLSNNNIRCKFIVVGNNDLSFSKDFVSCLSKYNYTKNELVISPNVITVDGVRQNPHVINRMSFFRKFIYTLYYSNFQLGTIMLKMQHWLSEKMNLLKRKDTKSYQKAQHIHMGIGAVYILTPLFFDHFEKLWDDFFLYGEEALLAGQLMSVNGKNKYLPELKIVHYESIATKKLPSRTKYDYSKKAFKVYRKYL